MPLIGILGAAWVLGGWAVRGGAEEPPWARVSLRLLAGLCLCGMIALVLGARSLSHAQWAFYAIAFVGLGLEAWRARGEEGLVSSGPGSAFPADFFGRLCVASVVVSLGLAVIGALAPVTGEDAVTAPMSLAKEYAQAGRIVPSNGLVASGRPQYGAALFAVVSHGTSEKPAQLLNVLFGVLLCGQLFRLGARFGGGGAGWMAAAIGATAPVFLSLSLRPSTALLHAAVVLAMLEAADAWRRSPSQGGLLRAAFFGGSACGMALTGWIAVLLTAFGLPFFGQRRRIRTALLFFFGALFFALPEMVHAARTLGDPLFPVLGKYLPRFVEYVGRGNVISMIPGYLPKSPLEIGPVGIGLHPSVQETGGNTLVALLRFPWDIVMRPGSYGGFALSAGPLVLALGIPALLLGPGPARVLSVFGAGGVAVLFFCLRTLHAMLPFFAPVWAAGALSVCGWERGRRAVTGAMALCFVLGLVWQASVIAPRWRVIAGMETRAEYLARELPRYAVCEALNRMEGPPGAVLMPEDMGYFVNRRAHTNLNPLYQIVRQPPLWRLFWLSDNEIRYVVYPLEFARRRPELAPLLPLFEAWRADRENFRLVKRIEARGESGAVETTEIYEVVFEG